MKIITATKTFGKSFDLRMEVKEGLYEEWRYICCTTVVYRYVSGWKCRSVHRVIPGKMTI